MSDVEVIVLDATGGGEMLRECLQSIVGAREIIVFDNGSRTPVHIDGVRIMRSETNIGFAAGVVAALIMLAAIVVLRVLSGVLSLPEVIAEGLLVMMPGALFSAVLDSLQHAAKPPVLFILHRLEVDLVRVQPGAQIG